MVPTRVNTATPGVVFRLLRARDGLLLVETGQGCTTEQYVVWACADRGVGAEGSPPSPDLGYPHQASMTAVRGPQG